MPTHTKQPTRFAIYARVSSDRQDVANSINAQISEAKKYSKAYEGIVTRIYKDDALSGREEHRPGFTSMIEDGSQPNPPFDAIIVWEYSRFFRDRTKSALYKELLRKRGIQCQFPSPNLKTTAPPATSLKRFLKLSMLSSQQPKASR